MRILKEREAFGNVREACRQNNVTEQTYYRWRNKFGGIEVSDAKRLRRLEHDNSELKKVVAELTLDNHSLEQVASKSGRPCQQNNRIKLPFVHFSDQ